LENVFASQLTHSVLRPAVAENLPATRMTHLVKKREKKIQKLEELKEKSNS